MEEDEIYVTISNRIRLYIVTIRSESILIEKEGFFHVIKNYRKYFIGENTEKYKHKLGDDIYVDSRNYKGSCILVETEKNKYIFIGGWEVFEFSTPEPILEFHSIMGNNVVPYPFALTENYVYLLIENVYLKRNFGDIEPYRVYYDYRNYKEKQGKQNHKNGLFNTLLSFFESEEDADDVDSEDDTNIVEPVPCDYYKYEKKFIHEHLRYKQSWLEWIISRLKN